jgi:hypothetical protein
MADAVDCRRSQTQTLHACTAQPFDKTVMDEVRLINFRLVRIYPMA